MVNELFQNATFALVVGAIFDGLSTAWFLEKYPSESEANPLLGSKPSKLRIFGEGAIYVAATLGIMYGFNSTAMACLNLIFAGAHLCAGTLNFTSNGQTPLALFKSWQPGA